MKKVVLAGLGLAVLSSAMVAAAKPAAVHPATVYGDVTIDNGVTGDGSVVVAVSAGGGADSLTVDPNGADTPAQVIYDYLPFVGPASGAASFLVNTTITSPPALSGTNQVTSSGTYAGPNGTINWTAVSGIQPGSPIYQTQLTFSSTQALGAIRVGAYLDEDVLGAGGDVLVLFGTPGTAGFQALTVDGSVSVGVAQSADYQGAVNATYAGWAAQPYSDLLGAIGSGPVAYSAAGVVTNLSPYVDARYPGQTAYGPEDITTAFAFDVDPAATTATVTVALGGSPDGQPPGGGGNPPPTVSVPVPASSWLGLLVAALGLFAAGLVAFARRGRSV